MRLALGRFFTDNQHRENVWCVIATRSAVDRHRPGQTLYAAIRVGCANSQDGELFDFVKERGGPEVRFFTIDGLCLKAPDLGRRSEVLRLVEIHEPKDPMEPDILDTLASIGGE